MSEKAYALALAAMLSATPVALAAQPRHSTGAGQNQEFIQSDQMRASRMIGSRVYDLHNRKVGRVRELVLGSGGKIDLVVVDVGSFFGRDGKMVAVKSGDLKIENSRLTLSATKEQIKQMANYNLRNPNTGMGSSTSPAHGGKPGSGH